MKYNNGPRPPRLAPLGELDGFRVADGNSDLRGWELYGSDNLRFGEVRDLVVDTDAMKARYMIVKLDRTLPNVSGDRQVLIPVRKARLDDALDRVYLDDVTVGSAYTLPDYRAENLANEQALVAGSQPGQQPAADSGEVDAGFIVIQRSTVSLVPGPDGSIILEEDVDEVVLPSNGADAAQGDAAAQGDQPPPGTKRTKEPV